jgi:transcriptional regulator with XRE-family HTH domain
MRAYSISARPVAPPTVPSRNPRQDAAGRAVNAHVAERIKLLRTTTGKTQAELGAILGMTFQQMAKYERGISKVAPDKLWKLAEYFGVEIAYFFEDLDISAQSSASERVRAPSAGDSAGNRRLRLELAGALQGLQSRKMMRSVLELMRASSE